MLKETTSSAFGVLPCLKTVKQNRLHIGVEDGQLGIDEDVPVVPDWLQDNKYVSGLYNPGFDVLLSVSCLADNAS